MGRIRFDGIDALLPERTSEFVCRPDVAVVVYVHL